MSRHKLSSGMVSVMFLLFVAPIVMILLCLGLELSHFFGTYDDVQRIVDRETRASLSKGLNEEETETVLRKRLAPLHSLIEVESIDSQKTSRWSESHIQGRFRGVFTELAARLTSNPAVRLPINVYARVRKVRSRALVVLDRTTLSPEALCATGGVQSLEAFVDSLGTSLVASGIEGVSVAVVPGAEQPVDILGPQDLPDLFSRCRPRNSAHPFDVSSLPASRVVHPAPEVAYGVLEAVRSELLSETAESRTLVFVQQARINERTAYAEAIFSLVDEDARARMSKMNGLHISIDGDRLYVSPVDESVRVGLSVQTVATSRREVVLPQLVAAVRGKIGERTVLVF